MPALSTRQVEMASHFPLVRIQLLSLQVLWGQVMPHPIHAPSICFPSVISGGTNANSAASESQLPLGLHLVCLFNSRCSKWGAVPKINLSLTGWVSGGSLCSKGEEKKSSTWDFGRLTLGLSSEVPLKGSCPCALTAGAAQGG